MTAARIPFPDDTAIAAALADAPPPLQKAAERGALINVFRMLMHSPDLGVAVTELGSAIFASAALTDIDRELAILACGACFRAPYEASQHDPISRSVGVSDRQRAAIAGKCWNDNCFTTAQQALLAFVAEVATTPAVSDAIFNAMRLHYSDRQLVETITLTGNYFLIGRLTTVLNVPSDPPADDVVLRAGRAMHNHRR
jgi:alkylhydroperoxidase family enzyme